MKSKTLSTTIQSLISPVSVKLTRFTSWLVRKVLSKMSRVIVDSKKGSGTFESDKPPVVTLVRRSDGQVRFPVREDLEDVDEDIVEYGDEDDPAILCTDQYSIYDGIDEYDGIDGHIAIDHDEHYVVGDVHTNSCENRHSFLRDWFRRFRGVSKHQLQEYLNSFSLTLNTDRWFERILSTDLYR
jgi:transposase-like protein